MPRENLSAKRRCNQDRSTQGDHPMAPQVCLDHVNRLSAGFNVACLGGHLSIGRSEWIGRGRDMESNGQMSNQDIEMFAAVDRTCRVNRKERSVMFAGAPDAGATRLIRKERPVETNSPASILVTEAAKLVIRGKNRRRG